MGVEKTTVYDNIIFCWVMHKQNILDDILNGIDTVSCNVKQVSLVCDEDSLRKRLEQDVKLGIRKNDVIQRSIERIQLYQQLNTIKIDTSNKSVEMVVREILHV